MKNLLGRYVNRYERKHKDFRRYAVIVAVLALVVFVGVNWRLHDKGISMTSDYQCGLKEHKHTADCYKKVLICGKEETDGSEGHTHTDACYKEEKKLTCDKEEHKHNADCYDEEGNLICDKEEHTHSEDCYTTEKKLICGKEESKPVKAHHHTDACYKKELVCKLKEHTHTAACYSNENADVEDKSDWEATIPTLSGNWAEDIVSVAESQIGYEESTANFKLADDGETRKGYTRYGDWYGNKYGDWSAMFASFCLNYAGISSKTVPVNSGSAAWITELKQKDLYKTADNYNPTTGDLVFLDTDSDGEADHVGIITATETKDDKEDSKVTSLTAVVGDSSDKVEEKTYKTSGDTIVGYCALPENPDEKKDAEATTAEKADEKTTEESTKTAKSGTDAESATAKKAESKSEAATSAESTTADKKVTSKNTEKTVDDSVDYVDATEITQQEEYCIVKKLDSQSTKIKVKSKAKAQIATQSIDANSIDFSDYITDATVSKIQNGEWVPSTDFKEGDQVRVNIQYKLPAGKVTGSQKTIYYQLPSGVHPLQDVSGTVYQGGTAVGTYEIGEDGLIQITFNDSFANGDAFIGDIQFSGTLSKTSDADSDKISFGGDSNSITVKKQNEQYDLSVKKEGTLEADGNTIDYTITASTTKGTENTVTIKDVFQQNSAKGHYDRDSFKIYKIDKDGNRTEVTDYTPTFGTESNGQEKFEITDLPKLAAGEKYEVSYKATATITSTDGSGKVANNGGAISGNQNKWDWSSVEISKSQINKEGSYDSETGLITWTVTVNQGKKDIGGYTFTDTPPQDIVGNAVIKDSSGKEIAQITPDSNNKLSYTFADGSSDTYQIIYKTKAPDHNGQVSNTGNIGKDGKDYSSGKDVWVSHRDWGLSKQWNGEEDSNGKHYYKWQSVVTLPDAALTSFTYTDTIRQATQEEGTSTPDENSHYAIASELQKQFEDNLTIRLNVNGKFKDLKYNNDYVNFVVKYFDKDDNEIAADDSTSHVQKFTITVTPKEGHEDIVGSKLTLNYSTIVDFSQMNEGDRWKFKNDGAIPNKEASADHTYTKPKTIEKQAGVDKGNYIEYNDGTTKVDYDTANGILYYRLFLRTEANANGEITLTDELPSGTTLIEDSVKGAFYESNWWSQTSCGNYNFEGDQKIKVTQDGQIVTMKIASGYNECGKVGSAAGGNVIVITYRVSIENDSFWEDLKNESKTYTNKVIWNGKSTEQNTTVDRDVENVQKSATQLKNDNGEFINTIAYKVVINPAAKDLLPDEDTLTLTDTMTVPDGVDAYLDLDSVHLYQYDSQKENNLGTEIDSSRYQLTYDQKTHKITLNLPDEMACVLTYNYNVDIGNKSEPQLKNKVSLIGEYENKTDTKVMTTDSSASVTKGKLTIYKVDQENYKKLLPGAKFSLEYWNGSSWQTQAKELISNNAGEIILDAAGTDNELKLDATRLYRLTETEAPSGYSKTGDVYYFIYKGPKQSGSILTNQQAYEKANAKNSGVDQKDIIFYGEDGGSLYVPNDYTQVSVKKVWVDNNNNVTKPGADSVKVQLYRHKGVLDGCHVTLQIMINSSLKWTQNLVVKEGSTITIRSQENTWRDDQSNEFSIQKDGKSFGTYVIEKGTPTGTTNEITEDCTIVVNGSWFAAEPNVSYRQATSIKEVEGTKEPVGDVIELNAANNWSYDWTELPKRVEGQTEQFYYYTLEEVDPPSGSSVSYTNNNGIQSGNITVTNKISTYTLPETGGSGTLPFITVGASLMGFALLCGYSMRRRRGRRVE